MKAILLVVSLVLALTAGAWAETSYTYQMVASTNDWSVPISGTDIINGMTGVITAGGFHPVTSGSTLAEKEQWLTDGQLGTNLQAILADFSTPALQISYMFPEQKVGEIRSFAANSGKDGRVFQDFDVDVFVAGDWYPLIQNVTTGSFYQSNKGKWEGSLIRIYEKGGAGLLEDTPISGVRFTYYMVDNGQDWFLPRGEGGLNTSSVIREIDVTKVPEPASFLALAAGMVGILLRRRSK